MTRREIQITVTTPDPAALAAFWKEALGYVYPAPPGVDLPEGADPLQAWDEFLERAGVPVEQRNSMSAIEDPEGVGPRVLFHQVAEPHPTPGRWHLDLRAAPGLGEGQARMDALEAECARLVALGAHRQRRFEPGEIPMGIGWIVMTDPDGNEFCLD